MTTADLERLCWLVVAGALLSIPLIWRQATPPTGVVTPLPVVAARPPRIPSDSLAEALDIVRDGNLFRHERESVSTDELTSAAPLSTTVTVVPKPPKPMLMLRGLLGGPPWTALIEGLPSREGAVVLRLGETHAGVTFRGVRHDTVAIVGFDTTWKLTVRR